MSTGPDYYFVKVVQVWLHGYLNVCMYVCASVVFMCACACVGEGGMFEMGQSTCVYGLVSYSVLKGCDAREKSLGGLFSS